VHSYGLVEAELEKEQDLLNRDLKQLTRLKADAKQESRLWKQQAKAVSWPFKFWIDMV
jgi:CENP-Q, a CENPA-CAD centromere complex subunit